MKKVDFMQASSFNFLENERRCDIVQRGGGHANQTGESDSAIRQTKPQSAAKVNDAATKSSASRVQPEKKSKQEVVTSEMREEAGEYAPKRYITKCYFQPKQNPVSYSETVILTLGSNKKHYFETVMYQTKLIPFRWIESMTTLTPQAREAFQACHQAYMDEPQFHYMSLEPQQNAAAEKLCAAEVAV